MAKQDKYLCDFDFDFRLPPVVGIYVTAEKITISGGIPKPEDLQGALERQRELREEYDKSRLESLKFELELFELKHKTIFGYIIDKLARIWQS